MSSKEELTALVTAKGEEIKALKAAKGDKSEIDKLVEQLKALKAKYQEVTGEAYPAPAPVEKKKETPAAPAATTEKEGPSKNDLKKAAKAAEKDKKRAEYKAAGGKDADAEVVPAQPLPVAAEAVTKTVVHGGAAASSNVLAGATLFANPSTALATAFVLVSVPSSVRAGMEISLNDSAELPRLVLAGEPAVQIVGDHSIARLVQASDGGVGGGIVAAAQADQWLDLCAMFCADEAPLLALLEGALQASTFLVPGTSAPGLADVAALACLTAPGAPPVSPAAHSAIARWISTVQVSFFFF